MEWRQTARNEWVLVENGFDGKAVINETNSGYVAAITVTAEEFGMELLNDRDFFENRTEAVAFLQQRMERNSY